MEQSAADKSFRKAVVIFIDILGSQGRKDFDEWYRIMSVFSSSVQMEKEYDKSHERAIYKREIHIFSDCAYIIYGHL